MSGWPIPGTVHTAKYDEHTCAQVLVADAEEEGVRERWWLSGPGIWTRWDVREAPSPGFMDLWDLTSGEQFPQGG